MIDLLGYNREYCKQANNSSKEYLSVHLKLEKPLDLHLFGLTWSKHQPSKNTRDPDPTFGVRSFETYCYELPNILNERATVEPERDAVRRCHYMRQPMSKPIPTT